MMVSSWKSDYLILSHLNTLKCSNAGQELLDLGRKVGLASTYQKLVLLIEILEDETLTYNEGVGEARWRQGWKHIQNEFPDC